MKRRELLAGAIAGAIVAPVFRPAADAQEALPENVDVAIVGGGISGLYSAWRLLTGTRGGAPPSVGVFEASNRFGGRIFSVLPEGMPHVPAELGAMRIVTSQAFVLALTHEMGLPLAEFPVGTNANLAYLRTKRFRLRDYAQPAMVPYALAPPERGKSPNDLLFGAIERLVPHYAKLDAAGWLAAKRATMWRGKPLWDRGFWNVLSEILSNEAISLIRDGGGYPCFVSNWNAAEAAAYLTSDFPAGAAYKTIRGGMQRLPLAVKARVERAGGTVRAQARLVSLSAVGGDAGGFRLVFAPARAGESPRIVNAKSVILALPKRAIELIDTGTLLAAPDVRRAFDAIDRVPATKVFFGYRTPWWRQLGLRSGRANTDLPMTLCFYFGTEGEQPGGDAHSTNSLLMASYANDGPSDFWRFAAGLSGAPLAIPVGDDLTKQLSAVHGLTLPQPYTSHAIDWSRDPYGAGWHIWRPGEPSWEMMPRIRRPVTGLPLSIVGEAWSTDAGWIEGALNTAEHALEDQYGLARPAWLPAAHVLGS